MTETSQREKHAEVSSAGADTAPNWYSFPMLIGGNLTESSSGNWITSVNPATGEEIGRVPAGTRQDIDDAVAAAERAKAAWAATSVHERSSRLRDLAAGLLARRDELLRIEVLDTGNTVRTMRGDVDKAVDSLLYYAGLGFELKGDTVPATPGRLHLSVREPYGTVGRIVPFNHPLLFAAGRLAAPLMAGNCVVIKPSEQSPLSAGVLAEVAREVFPPGVVNIVTGFGHEAGDALVRHPDVRRLAFTGSAATGMAIQRAAAETSVKLLTLELGGKNPLIVFPDADLEGAIRGAVAGMNFGHQGQSCGSTSRVLIHESVYDEVVEGIRIAVERLRVGDPLDDASDMGPMNSVPQFEKTLSHIARAEREGARLIAGGGTPRIEGFEDGLWVEPTVFEVTSEMTLFNEEVFGPVMAIAKWSDVDEVVSLANAVEYGLTAAIWTRDLNSALTTARRIEAGYIFINDRLTHYPGTSFGGTKNSGIGKEEGLEELLSYTEEKFIHVNLS